jgi:Xaa-Pro aminopeptidase
MLSADERAWIDDYHTLVRETLNPHLDVTTRAWLLAATIPLPRE